MPKKETQFWPIRMENWQQTLLIKSKAHDGVLQLKWIAPIFVQKIVINILDNMKSIWLRIRVWNIWNDASVAPRNVSDFKSFEEAVEKEKKKK